MGVVEKLRVVESLAVPKDNIKVEVLGGTSIKSTFSCGCVLVEHFCRVMKTRPLRVNERYFVELCDAHKYLE